MKSENSLLIKYNKLPKWLRWILFLPISLISSVILWFIILWFFLKNNDGIKDIFGFSFVIELLHPVVVQVIFLYLVFFTVPQGKLMWVKILIMLRALFLIIFITQPVLNFMEAGLPYDMKFFEEFIGEILTLIASIWLFRELKNRPT